MKTRAGDGDDFVPVMRVFEGSLLDVDAGRVRAVLAGDANEREVLVAEADGHVVGALLLDGDEIAAIAVTAERRGRGIGRALVEAAAERRERLVADFRPAVREFYESLGFDVRERADEDEDGRLRGVLESSSAVSDGR